MSGLEGIKKDIMPSAPTDLNVYNLTYEERRKLKIQSLPESFGEALEEFEQSNLMKKILGAELFENFLLEKRKEWELYRAHVSEWEIERYLRKL
jgi:glutamine synthetase